MKVSQLFNTLLFTQQQQEEEQEVRVSQLFNTLLFTQQQQEEQEVTVSQLFNTLLFTQQQQEEEQEVTVSQLFNTLLFTQQQQEEQEEVKVSQFFNTLHYYSLSSKIGIVWGAPVGGALYCRTNFQASLDSLTCEHFSLQKSLVKPPRHTSFNIAIKFVPSSRKFIYLSRAFCSSLILKCCRLKFLFSCCS